MKLQEIRGSLSSSRFMVAELVNRQPYEPRIATYVRVDTPIPLMHRRVPSPDGGYRVERMMREGLPIRLVPPNLLAHRPCQEKTPPIKVQGAGKTLREQEDS